MKERREFISQSITSLLPRVRLEKMHMENGKVLGTYIHTSTPISLYTCINVKQFSAVQSFDRLGRRVDLRDDSAEIHFQSFCRRPL